MKTFLRSIYLVPAIMILAVAVLASSAAVVREFKADIPDPDKNEIHLKWVVEAENNLQHYIIKRKMVRDVDFQVINTVNPKPGQGLKTYNYTDRNVFRTTASPEPVVYELHVMHTNGSTEFIGQAQVNYSSTAVRRTWGSIKAMFQ